MSELKGRHQIDFSDDDESSNDGCDELVQKLDAFWSKDGNGQGSFVDSAALRTIGKYSLSKVLGSGGFGIVYLANDTELNRLVALKVPRPEVLFDAEKSKRFRLEAKMAAKLDHPNIVKIYEANLTSPTPYIAAAFCLGLNLAEWIERQSSLPTWQDSARMIVTIAEAIDYAHSEGVFHRDLKPANVLLVANQPTESLDDLPLSDLTAKVTDFGLGKLIGGSIADTRSSLMIGTPLYMAPEQFDFAMSDECTFAATDVYSLGEILFELLTFEHPFEASNHFETVERIRHQAPKEIRRINPTVPKALQTICYRCLEKNPAHRYDTPKDLANDLIKCLNGTRISHHRVSPFQRLVDFASNEKRISEAGNFTLWAQLVVSFWIVLVWAIVLPANEMRTDKLNNADVNETLLHILITLAGLAMPLAWLGWQTTRRKQWAISWALLMTLSCFPALFLGCLGRPLFFAAMYEKDPTFAPVVHVLLFSIHIAQAILLSFAWIAMRRINQKSTNVAATQIFD